MESLNNEIKLKINQYRKNGLDISELINNKTLKGADLHDCIIRNFNPTEKDLRGINLSGCLIGGEGIITQICDKDFRGSEFIKTKFTGRTFARRSDFRGSNFQNAELPYFEYQKADLRECNFCEILIRLGVAYGLGAKIDKNIFQDLGKNWGIEIIFKDNNIGEK